MSNPSRKRPKPVNEQNRKQIIIVAVLGAALIGVLVYQFVLTGSPTPPAAPAGNAQSASVAPGATTARPAAGRPAPGAAASATAIQDPLDPKELDSLIARIQRVTFHYPEVPGRDPLVPLIREGLRLEQGGILPITGPGAISVINKQVTAIIWNDSVQWAVVDDIPVWPGYVYPDGVVVEAIERDKVVFRFEDKRYPIPLKDSLKE